MWQGWMNFILGLWLVLSAFVGNLQTPANLIITGILCAVFGFWTYKNWQGDINGILGVWLIISGLFLNMVTMANFLIIGILMTVFGLWRGMMKPEEMHTRQV